MNLESVEDFLNCVIIVPVLRNEVWNGNVVGIVDGERDTLSDKFFIAVLTPEPRSSRPACGKNKAVLTFPVSCDWLFMDQKKMSRFIG